MGGVDSGPVGSGPGVDPGSAPSGYGGGDGGKQVRHVGFSRVVDLHPIYIASRVPTLAFWESFLFS